MAQPAPVRPQVQFGPFTADLRTRELWKYGTRIKLQERPFEILIMLLEHPGEVVSREDIRVRLWPDGTFVDFDNNISSAVGKLRTALLDSAATPRYIETVGRRGYRFIGEAAVSAAEPSIVPESGPKLEIVAKRSSQGRHWWVLAATAALVVAAAAFFYFRQSEARTNTPPTGGKMMLAVLPFANLTGDPAQDYFSDGFTEEMITQVGRFNPERLGVIARTSVMAYKNRQEALNRVGSELGVQYILEGSVRRDGSHVRITAQLIQVHDQTHLWAREYDREVKDLLVLQNEIAQEIADEIRLTLTDRKTNESSRPEPLSENRYEAYDLYLKGRYFWNQRSGDGFRQSAAYFQQAVAKDPNYARAYAGLADAYALMSSYFYGPQAELMPKARVAALKALQLEDGLAEAHASLALIAENYDYDWATAEKEYRRAIQLDGNYATAHQWYAEFLAFEGRSNEALAESERARQLDPQSLIIAVDRGAIFYYARNYAAAIAQLRSVLDMNPNLSRAEGVLTWSFIQQGKFEDASKVAEHIERVSDRPWGSGLRAVILFRTGQHERGLQLLAKAEQEMRDEQRDPAALLATMYAGMGEKDRALASLEKNYQAHSNLMTTLKVDPIFDPLRTDPRFQDVLRRAGLNP